jgi:hypothetical protein
VTTTVANTIYTLTVAIGDAQGTNVLDPAVSTIQLLIDGTPFASAALGNGNLIPEGGFFDVTVQFFAFAGGQDLDIRLAHAKTSDPIDRTVYFDNVRLDATSLAPAPGASVPEPSALAIMAVGGLGLVALARRRLSGGRATP